MIGMDGVFMGRKGSNSNLGFGCVVESTHADNQTLAIVEGYNYRPVAESFWSYGSMPSETNEQLLRSWADRMGYRLVKKSVKKDF